MKVHIADDHQIIIQGYTALLKANGIQVSGFSTDGKNVIEWFQNNNCDVLILDISMPKLNGIEILQYLKEKKIKHKTIVVSAYDDVSFIQQAIKYGAKGFVLKDEAAEVIVPALLAVYNGKKYFSEKIKDVVIDAAIEREDFVYIDEFLSPKEKDVLKMLVNGYSTSEMGETLNTTPSSIRTFLSRLKYKLNVKTKVGLALIGLKHNIGSR